MVILIRHDPGCEWARPAHPGHSDAAKRVADTANLHREAGAAFGPLVLRQHLNRIFACALADGTSDGVLYDTRRDAIAHQHHNEKWYAYLRVSRFPMTVCEAESVLKWHREAYDKGLVFVDRDAAAGPGRTVADLEIIPRMTAEDHRTQLAALSRRN